MIERKEIEWKVYRGRTLFGWKVNGTPEASRNYLSIFTGMAEILANKSKQEIETKQKIASHLFHLTPSVVVFRFVGSFILKSNCSLNVFLFSKSIQSDCERQTAVITHWIHTYSKP